MYFVRSLFQKFTSSAKVIQNTPSAEQSTEQLTQIDRKSPLVKISHTWKIENFSLCDVLNEEGYIDSKPLGDDKNITFTIRVYPDNDGQVSFFLKFESKVCETLIVRWECVMLEHAKIEYKRKNSKFVMTSGSLSGWKDFAIRSEITGENTRYDRVVAKDGSLTVKFEICYDESSLMDSKAPNEIDKNENSENTTQPIEK